MEAINLFQLFNDKIFRIADYQRGYSWGDKQLTELWDDLEEIEKENDKFRNHYTGTIYLELESSPLENEKWITGAKFYNVVDGQQRLTTLTILLFELLRLANKGYGGEQTEDLTKVYVKKTNLTGNSTVYKFSYNNRDKNHPFLLKRIFEDKNIILPNGSVNLYAKNLLYAKEFFRTKLEKFDSITLENLYLKITTALLFDVRFIEKGLDVQAVFETMNNRGKPLSTLEKLKNRLIYLTEKLPKTESHDRHNLRVKINTAWGEIYSSLAQNPEVVLEEDVFLSAHLSLFRKYKEAVFSENTAEEKLFQMFCNRAEKFDKDDASNEKEEAVSYSKIEDYVIKLSEAAPIWYQIQNSDLLVVNKILLMTSSKEIKVFLLALFYKISDQAILTKILTRFEKLLFRNRVMWVFDERLPANWGRELYNEEDTADGVLTKIDALLKTPFITSSLVQTLNNYFTYVKGSKGFHRWSLLKYFLFEYEQHLKKEYNESHDKVTLKDYDDTTIEHIIPQKYDENWKIVVDNFCGDLVEEKREVALKVMLNTLGNLTILKDGKNSSLGNRSWEEKKERFSTGSYNEIEISKYESWTKAEIAERGLKMLNLLVSRFEGLSLSDDEKRKILYYEDFIVSKFQ